MAKKKKRFGVESIYNWTGDEKDRNEYMIFDYEMGGSTNYGGNTKEECEQWLRDWEAGKISTADQDLKAQMAIEEVLERIEEQTGTKAQPTADKNVYRLEDDD